MFLQDAEELLESEVDESVEMDVEESLEDALARAVDACVRILDVPRPTTEQMGQALAAARDYSPKTRREAKEKQEKKEKTKQPRYYALLPEVDVEQILDKRFKGDETSEESGTFYQMLKANGRVTDRPHITIVHEKNLPGEQELWERAKCLSTLATPPLFSFKLTDVVWNDRVMAIPVSDIVVSEDDPDPETNGADFVVNLSEELTNRLHITVGTKSKDVPPVEAMDLVVRWKQGEKGIESCKLGDIWVKGRMKGLFS